MQSALGLEAFVKSMITEKFFINFFCYFRMLQHNMIAFISKQTFARTTSVIRLYVFTFLVFRSFSYFKSSQEKDVQLFETTITQWM